MKKKILGVIITVLFFVFILYKTDFNAVITSIQFFSPKSIFYILLFYIVSLVFRGIRWKLFLGNEPKYNWLHLSEIFTIGTMLNIFFPARAGDIYRAYYLGNIKSEKKLKIFGSVILERIFDGSAILLILTFAVFNYFKSSKLINATLETACLVFLGSLISAFILFKSGRIEKIFDKLFPTKQNHPRPIVEKFKLYTKSFSEGFQILYQVKATSKALGYSILIWGLECIMTYLIINSFGIKLPISASLFVLSLTTISTMIPSSSIFLGPFQAAYILALSIYGIEKEFALAISVVHNIILVLIISTIGFACLTRNNIKNTTNS